MKGRKIPLFVALLPVAILIILLAFNVLYISGSDALSGSNQLILIFCAFLTFALSYRYGTTWRMIQDSIADNIKQSSPAILILLLIGSLAAVWTFSGIVPTMIYYGLKILNPLFFLPLTVLVSSIVSLATGSSWSTSATVGIAMMGIGNSLGISPAISAGAILTGAYFGDKLSPLSDTTNLAAAVAGTDLARHIRYMSITTIPTYTISLLIFTGISLTKSTFSVESAATGQLVEVLQQNFYITPYSLLVPALVIFLIAFRFPSIPAIFVGLLGGIISALLFQTDFALSGLDYRQKISLLMQVITTSHETHTGLDALDELLSTGGMAGMLNTVWLIISAMCFGGAMEASGFLRRITDAIMSLAKSEFSLFAATTGTTLFVNITASDQYLSLVIPGKMYAPSYTQKGLAPENLSRTLEDSGTVTSVLIPWNTCGAYHSGILGVATFSYLPFVFFSLLSPFTTLLVAALQIKIKRL
ncbi:Na+/H+ antiporter NhaC [Schleiferia thermophila]|uniref:Transporter (NhaC family) n=1 Tax=Schleiferia thermophila TaxID=884107 RepID=A0A369AA85_9FLAO|nr:Na+/H+ antiporter NhaC [Schleiferia thermophila]RCX05206.1 transporter (NhaC family) [Schleiferia thermophila]